MAKNLWITGQESPENDLTVAYPGGDADAGVAIDPHNLEIQNDSVDARQRNAAIVDFGEIPASGWF